jgi:hypothetical protein
MLAAEPGQAGRQSAFASPAAFGRPPRSPFLVSLRNFSPPTKYRRAGHFDSLRHRGYSPRSFFMQRSTASRLSPQGLSALR